MTKDSKNTPEQPLPEETMQDVPATETPAAEPAPAAEQAPAEDPLAVLQAQVEELTRQRDEYLDMARRIQAEFDNYRRRNREAQAEAALSGTADALCAMLPVLDNLERALAVPDTATDASAIREGVVMIHRQMCEALAALGLEEIPAQGCVFDPNLHNAVLQGEAREDCPAGSVLEVIQKGYRMKDRIIRHSMVKVAK